MTLPVGVLLLLAAALQDGGLGSRSGLQRQGSAASPLPAGSYECYTYHPRAVHVGTLRIEDGTYRTSRGAGGRYRRDGDRVEWLGEPPLGFRVAVLESREPPKLRLYLQASDIGNTWKAAVCSRKEGTEGGGGAGGGRSTGAPAAPAGGAFAPGTRVLATFIGVDYGATVVRCEGARCLVHYDDPASRDEWVDTSRLKRR